MEKGDEVRSRVMVLTTCILIAHGLHVMKNLKGIRILGYSIQISLQVRGGASLCWLGQIWSKGKSFISLLVMVMELRDTYCGILLSINHE
jgi:hypothetical protein